MECAPGLAHRELRTAASGDCGSDLAVSGVEPRGIEVIIATLGTAGGASPPTFPAAIATVMVDVAFVTQLRLSYDVAVLYRVPLYLSDPDDMWKLIRVAFTSGCVSESAPLASLVCLRLPITGRLGMQVNPVIRTPEQWVTDADSLVLQIKTAPTVDVTTAGKAGS